MKDYINDLSFQNLFSHVKYYKKESGTNTPDILMNNNDWINERDTYAWIGIRRDESINTNTEIWIEEEYVDEVCNYTTIDRFLK